jgi:hypothetical protein
LQEIQKIQSHIMPFTDANNPPTSPPPSGTTSGTERGTSSGNSANGCCIPNVYVNVSPRFNQQLLSTEPRTGYSDTRNASTGNGVQSQDRASAQTPSTTGFHSPQQPRSNEQQGASTQGMQRTEGCNECEEDDDDLEFYINDDENKRKRVSLSNNGLNTRFVAFPQPRQRTEFI